MNRKDLTLIMLAILTAIFACSCHEYSVNAHKAQGDTFTAIVSNKPTEEPKAVYGQIRASETYAESEEKEVKVLIDDGIPEEVKASCEKWGKEYNICPELLESLAYQESRFVSDIESKDGSCIGICQINPKWHKDRMKRLGVTDLKDADQNIHVAADYLSELFEEFEGDVDYLLMAYNGDSRWKSGYVSKYAKEILERSAQYEQLHDRRNF